jgi:hypothetical protein
MKVEMGTRPRRQDHRVAPAEFWENVEPHIALLEKNGFRESAAILSLYAIERERLATAIQNLENQLTILADKHREVVASHGQLVGILRRAGMDPETLIRSDEVFGDP